MISHFIFVEMPLCYRGKPRFSGESSLLICWIASSYWRKFHYMVLLIEGSFITWFFLLKEFSSHVSTYCGSSLSPLIEGFFITYFFLLKEFSLFVHWSSSDQFNPALSHWHLPGILLQFLDLLLGHQLQNIVFFTNFFMFKDRGLLSIAITDKESIPQREAECLRYQG